METGPQQQQNDFLAKKTRKTGSHEGDPTGGAPKKEKGVQTKKKQRSDKIKRNEKRLNKNGPKMPMLSPRV